MFAEQANHAGEGRRVHSVRAFLAIALNESVRAVVASWQEEVRRQLPGFQWVEPGNLHLTLRFLGNTPSNRLADIEKAAAAVGAGIGAFSLELFGVGAFPGMDAPRVLWIGARENAALSALHGSLEEVLARLGWPRESRRFRAHLTVARARDGRRTGVAECLAPCRRRAWGTVEVTRFTLYRSTLTPEGPIYTPLAEFPLKAG